MKYSRSGILILALATLVFAGLLFTSLGLTRRSSAQGPEKSLNIERYPGEPLEIVDISVGALSLKHAIKTKNRINGPEGLDIVKFSEGSGWHKRIS